MPRSGLEPRQHGVSVIWRRPTASNGPSLAAEANVVLLLGCAGNALAAAEGTLPGVRVSHTVCVADPRIASQVTAAAAAACAGPTVCSFPMTDRMNASEEVDFTHELAEPLAQLEACVEEAAGLQPTADGSGMLRGVLVHCRLGHNRSPALALAFLVSKGLSLREAYRRVLSARPTVDPLPPYRRALRDLELQLQGAQTVSGDEPFAMHVSELLALVEVDAGGFPEAMALKQASIDDLLQSHSRPGSPKQGSGCFSLVASCDSSPCKGGRRVSSSSTAALSASSSESGDGSSDEADKEPLSLFGLEPKAVFLE